MPLYATNNRKYKSYRRSATNGLQKFGDLSETPVPVVIPRNMVMFTLQNSRKLTTQRRLMPLLGIFYIKILESSSELHEQ
jgi:hypothetical protein